MLKPSKPTSHQEISATFFLVGCPILSESTMVTGTTVTTIMSAASCVIATPAPASWTERIGVLPAGTYTYEIYVRYDGSSTLILLSRQVFVVTQAVDVPAFTPLHLLMLGLFLSCVAMVMLRSG